MVLQLITIANRYSRTDHDKGLQKNNTYDPRSKRSNDGVISIAIEFEKKDESK